ncbi:MAG: GNAT family N-acetyltransferase [Neisseriaceae bacterium]|nr:MAG: GNAT family N-acetyltransferase [Neisseriaceae bacterium]
MLEVRRYDPSLKEEWDDFLKVAKNSHFMFNRDYMDYHSDRFTDFSLMLYYQSKLIALLPANIVDDVLFSHQGLTFGGLVMHQQIKTKQVLDCFIIIINFFNNNNIKRFIYKCIPYIYSKLPSDEDRYALFINNFILTRRDITTSIFLNSDLQLEYTDLRKRSIKKAMKSSLEVVEQFDFKGYWTLLTDVLSKTHNTKPVHSYQEIQQLRDRFPQNIKLFIAQDTNKTILAGAVLFISSPVIHTQYLASSMEGRDLGALDLVIDHILNNRITSCSILDFGISNENNGRYLNEGLIAQKEGFGGRGVIHDFYELAL